MRKNQGKRGKNEPGGKRIGKSRLSKTSSKNKPRTPEREFETKMAKYKKKPLRRISSKPTNIPKKKGENEEMRLNRFIANAGVCSRREADTFIEAGMVSVNGKPAIKLGTKVKPTDEVRFDGRRLNPEKKVYLLLNKPKKVHIKEEL